MAKMTDIPTPHDLRKGELQWTPIGGNFRDGAGANCHIYHYRENHGRYNEQNSFLIVDAGLQFLPSIPGQGLRSRAPDIEDYLTGPHKKLMILTHGHNDHIGAIPHWVKAGHPLPVICATAYTISLLEHQLAKQEIPPSQWPEMVIIKPGQNLNGGPGIQVELTSAGHSLPGALSLLISTPAGHHFHSGDIKADQTMILATPSNFKVLAEWGDEDRIGTALMDCAGAHNSGFAKQDATVRAELMNMVASYPDQRVLFAGSGSYAETLASYAAAAAMNDRALIYDGGSCETQFMAMQKSGLNLADIVEAHYGKRPRILAASDPAITGLAPNQILAVISGGDGNSNGGIARALASKSTWWAPSAQDVLFAPGARFGEDSVAITAIQTALLERGVTLVPLENHQVLGEGHGRAGDYREYLKAIRPKAVIPTHGTPKMTTAMLDLATEHGIRGVACYNGSMYRLSHGGPTKIGQRPEKWLNIGFSSHPAPPAPTIRYDRAG